jgi:FkbM family methyltransferase
MSKLRQAQKIYTQENILSLINKSANYIKNTIFYYLWSAYPFKNSIVNVNNISIDLGHDVFSPMIKNRIRRKSYENSERELINKYLYKKHPVIDLGAGIGYTACLADKKTDNSTPIIAIEANKSLIPVIKRTRNLNNSDFNVLHSAYEPINDSVEFQVKEDFRASSRYDDINRKQNNLTVPAVSIDEILEKFGVEDQIQLIVDIEGGEHDLLTNEQRLLHDKVKLIIFEYHTFSEDSFECYKNILNKNGFEFAESQGDVYVFRNNYL